MVRAMLRRANSFRGRVGSRLNLLHLLLIAVGVVSLSGFSHLYFHGFFSSWKVDSGWHFGASPGAASLSRNVASLQVRVGKGMEDIQSRMSTESAETLEEALHQLRSERRKTSNLLVEVAVSLDLVQAYFKQAIGQGNKFTPYIPRSYESPENSVRDQSERMRETTREDKEEFGMGKGPEEADGKLDAEEGEWGEEEETKEVDPLVEFFEIEEIRKYLKSKPSRLGKKNIMGANATHASIGHACVSRKFELEQYMDYDVGDYCADDWMLGQKLIIHGCDPLPRRRCFVRAPKTYQKPLPINESLWTVPDDRNVRWDSYICKGFKCLAGVDRKGFFKCNECFSLEGHEKPKWMQLTNLSTDADFLLEEVLKFKPGGIRIGLDFSVGVGTFAARMREHNVTIASATLNLGAPFNEIIALRGLLPLYLSVNQRLPFFDNTLDIVHSTLFLDGWIDHQLLDFILFDWDRVLRPGGLLWIDRFFCKKTDMDDYLYYFEQLRYNRLKWVVAPKVDKDDSEAWFSAVLEKPPRPF